MTKKRDDIDNQIKELREAVDALATLAEKVKFKTDILAEQISNKDGADDDEGQHNE